MEVLVVMAIMATLLGIGVGAIKSMATSKGVSTAVPLAESMFSQARKVAKSSGVPTRVVIYTDDTGDNQDTRERYLRMMGVATGRDAAGVPVTVGNAATEWRLVSRPITIPSNTFFNENLSVGSGDGTAIFPGTTTAKECVVYEFNAEGALIFATADGSGASVDDGQFVVQAGKLRPGETAPDVDKTAKRDAGGFRIFANGRMAKFQSPKQIPNASDDPEFE